MSYVDLEQIQTARNYEARMSKLQAEASLNARLGRAAGGRDLPDSTIIEANSYRGDYDIRPSLHTLDLMHGEDIKLDSIKPQSYNPGITLPHHTTRHYDSEYRNEFKETHPDDRPRAATCTNMGRRNPAREPYLAYLKAIKARHNHFARPGTAALPQRDNRGQFVAYASMTIPRPLTAESSMRASGPVFNPAFSTASLRPRTMNTFSKYGVAAITGVQPLARSYTVARHRSLGKRTSYHHEDVQLSNRVRRRNLFHRKHNHTLPNVKGDTFVTFESRSAFPYFS